jgi:hypothetical protein
VAAEASFAVTCHCRCPEPRMSFSSVSDLIPIEHVAAAGAPEIRRNQAALQDARGRRYGSPIQKVGPLPQARGEAGRRASSARAHRFALKLRPMLDVISVEVGRTTDVFARELTRRGVPKARGGTVWTPADARKLLQRLIQADL